MNSFFKNNSIEEHVCGYQFTVARSKLHYIHVEYLIGQVIDNLPLLRLKKAKKRDQAQQLINNYGQASLRTFLLK